MDLEQLKLILDLARDAGQGAMVIAVLWVLKGYFGGLCGLVVAYLVFRLSRFAIVEFSFIGQVEKACGKGSPLLGREKEAILRTLRAQK